MDAGVTERQHAAPQGCGWDPSAPRVQVGGTIRSPPQSPWWTQASASSAAWTHGAGLATRREAGLGARRRPVQPPVRARGRILEGAVPAAHRQPSGLSGPATLASEDLAAWSRALRSCHSNLKCPRQ